MEKRRKFSLLFHEKFSPLFPQYLKKKISNFRSQFTYSFVECGYSIYFCPDLKIWYVEERTSRSISEIPLDIDITKVDCMWFIYYTALFVPRGNSYNFTRGNSIKIVFVPFSKRDRSKRKGSGAIYSPSRKHAYIILIPSNPTFI